MPKLKLDKEGYLLDDDGKRVQINGEDVQVADAMNQERVNEVIKERLARETKRIETLEKQANRTPELERMIEEAKAEKAKLEEAAQAAQSNAEKQVAAQMEKARKEAAEYKTALDAERQARVRDQVTTAILSKAGGSWLNPAKDIVPDLLQAHKREPVLGADGKPLAGQFKDLFALTFKNEKGEEVSETVPVERALEILASRDDYKHYLKATGRPGSGGGQFNGATGGMKRSQMTDDQKAAFIGEHGADAFKALPD